MTKIPARKWGKNKSILKTVKSGDRVEVSNMIEEAQLRMSLSKGLGMFRSSDRKWMWIFNTKKEE